MKFPQFPSFSQNSLNSFVILLKIIDGKYEIELPVSILAITGVLIALLALSLPTFNECNLTK